MGSSGFYERGRDGATRVAAGREMAGAPGKVTRTSQLGGRPSSTLPRPLLRQAVAGVAESILRQQIEREARRMARAGLDRVAGRLDELEKYRHLSPAQRKAILDRAEAAMEGAHRKRIAQHAQAQAEEYDRVVAQLEGKQDERSAHLRKIAGENAEGYRREGWAWIV